MPWETESPEARGPELSPEEIADWGIGHWAIDFRKNQKITTKKKSGYRVPVWVKSSIRTRIDNPIKLSVRVPESKKLNISVRVPKNSVRVSGFRFRIFLNTPSRKGVKEKG